MWISGKIRNQFWENQNWLDMGDWPGKKSLIFTRQRISKWNKLDENENTIEASELISSDGNVCPSLTLSNRLILDSSCGLALWAINAFHCTGYCWRGNGFPTSLIDGRFFLLFFSYRFFSSSIRASSTVLMKRGDHKVRGDENPLCVFKFLVQIIPENCWDSLHFPSQEKYLDCAWWYNAWRELRLLILMSTTSKLNQNQQIARVAPRNQLIYFRWSFLFRNDWRWQKFPLFEKWDPRLSVS